MGEQKYGHSKLIERALGVALCRDPDRIKKCRQRVVPAVRELERALVQNDPNRSQVALRALGAFGDRALQGLGDDAAQRAREIEAELEVKEAERLGKKEEASGEEWQQQQQPQYQKHPILQMPVIALSQLVAAYCAARVPGKFTHGLHQPTFGDKKKKKKKKKKYSALKFL